MSESSSSDKLRESSGSLPDVEKEGINTYTPMLWAALNEDGKWREYVQVRQEIASLRADLQRTRVRNLDLSRIFEPAVSSRIPPIEEVQQRINELLKAEADLQRVTDERDALEAHREHWCTVNDLNHAQACKITELDSALREERETRQQLIDKLSKAEASLSSLRARLEQVIEQWNVRQHRDKWDESREQCMRELSALIDPSGGNHKK